MGGNSWRLEAGGGEGSSHAGLLVDWLGEVEVPVGHVVPFEVPLCWPADVNCLGTSCGCKLLGSRHAEKNGDDDNKEDH